MSSKKITRRKFLKRVCGTLVTGGVATLGYTTIDSFKNRYNLEWKEYFKKNYRLMTPKERRDTVRRLESLTLKKEGVRVSISDLDPIEDVLFGYAFNLTRCEGFMECVAACTKENNLDPEGNMEYIRTFEMKPGSIDPASGDGKYFHEVPIINHFYMGVQCFHCENAPCTRACPTKATWKEKDGIVVVDYDWCIGCRYCMAACPYYGRRFNWKKPIIQKNDIRKKEHYLGNRLRPKGVVEKCTFCIQRSRKGLLPACVEACPTGARVFGNLLDRKSEIRFVLENKKVFRIKEDLETNPKFWYFID